MIDETIHFQNPATEIFAIPENSFFQFLHVCLHDQTIFPDSTTDPTSARPAGDSLPVRTQGTSKGWMGPVLESSPVTAQPQLILASNSPRRRQLLALAGWPFSVSAADVDETPYPNESPAGYVLRLAEAKARAVAATRLAADQLVLAADTTVVDGSEILGKPANAVEAVAMLKRLRGHTHQVYSGIALLRLPDGLLLTDLCVTPVPMRDYSDEEILAYVQTGDPLDKAGAYAIQHPQFHPVASLDGCYASVMGLPMCHVLLLMRKMNIHPNADFFAGCETLLEYQCPIDITGLRESPPKQSEGGRDR
jgi:MAF protein